MKSRIELPNAIAVSRYKGYAEEQLLELRPLTLLYGRNNSGKSALLRSLPVLSSSIRSARAQALDMACPALRGAAFAEVECRFPLADPDASVRDMTLGLRWRDGGALDVAFDWPDRKLVSVSNVRVDGASAPWWRRRISKGGADDSSEVYECIDDLERAFAVQLSGLSLNSASNAARNAGEVPRGLSLTEDSWNAFGEQVQWLQASRNIPRQTSSSDLHGSFRLEHDGRDAVAKLVERPELLKIVGEWFELNLGARLQIAELDRAWEARLEYSSQPGLPINLTDTGEGNVQVLPVLVALAAAQDGSGPPIVALEEPESHLHPTLQAALAERVCALASNESPTSIVLETHSEHLLLTIQRLVLEGLDPSRVALYWVEQLPDGRSVAELVEVKRDGTFSDSWPLGVFGETPDLARQITRMQLAQLPGEQADEA